MKFRWGKKEKEKKGVAVNCKSSSRRQIWLTEKAKLNLTPGRKRAERNQLREREREREKGSKNKN
jgi:hypothetical protein